MRGKSPISKYLILSIIILAVGIPTAYAQTAPAISSAVWDDADNSDNVLSVGDTLTLTFDVATDRPGGIGIQTKAYVDSMFSFENTLGTDYTGQWTSTTQFTITITDANGGTALIGDDIMRNSTIGFIQELSGGTFSDPQGVTTNSTDFIFVADITEDNVQIFNPDGTYTGVNLSGATFTGPNGITINSTDFIFVGDITEDTVQIFNPDGMYTGVNLSGATFTGSIGITTNSTDFIFVGDVLSDNVQIFNPDGTYTGVNLSGTFFVTPVGLATNSTDFIFSTDPGQENIRIFNPDGTYTGVNFSGGTFPGPVGITTNSTDFVFVADFNSNIVHIFNPVGIFVGTLNPSVVGGSTFVRPEFVHSDNNDRILVSDRDGVRIQVFGPTTIKNSAQTSTIFTNTITTTGDFGVCFPPPSGDWVVNTSCTMSSSPSNPTINNGDLIVQNNSVLTIPAGVSLDIDFTLHNLTVESGSGVLIKSGGKIT